MSSRSDVGSQSIYDIEEVRECEEILARTAEKRKDREERLKAITEKLKNRPRGEGDAG